MIDCAYLDGKHARLDLEDKRDQSLLLHAWYEQVSQMNKDPQLLCEFIRGWRDVEETRRG